MSEKNQGKVRDFEVDDKWQPCFITLKYFFGYNIRIFPKHSKNLDPSYKI